MSYLSRSGIDFDEVRISSARFQHEIKSVETGKTEPASHPLNRCRHFSVLDQAHHSCVSLRTSLVDNLKMETREDGTLPASDGAGCLAAGHERLGVDHRPTPQD